MNSDDIVKILVQVGLLIPVIAAAVVVVVAAIRKEGKKTDDVLQKVNGAHTASQLEIKGLRGEVQSLKEDRAEKKEIASVLAAQSTLQTPTTVVVANTPENPVPVLPPPPTS